PIAVRVACKVRDSRLTPACLAALEQVVPQEIPSATIGRAHPDGWLIISGLRSSKPAGAVIWCEASASGSAVSHDGHCSNRRIRWNQPWPRTAVLALQFSISES